jgi:hypothetical protein
MSEKYIQRLLLDSLDKRLQFRPLASFASETPPNNLSNGFRTKDPREITFVKLVGEHLGLPEDEINKILYGPNDGNDLENCFKEYYADLSPIAADVIDLTNAELQKHITGLKFSNNTQINAESLKSKDGKYSIVVHPPIAMYCWKISKLWATLFGNTSEHNFKHTTKLASKLMKSFWGGNINKVEIISILELDKDQTYFAGSMRENIEKFIIGHELGHILMDIAPDKFKGISNLMFSASQSAIDIIEKSYKILPKNDSIKFMSKDKLADKWRSEFVADFIGSFLTIQKAGDDQASKIRAYCAIDSSFSMLDMLENYFVVANKRIYPLSKHPPSILRLQMLRAMIRMNEWEYAFVFSNSMDDINRGILFELGLINSEYSKLAGIRIELND